MHVMHTKAHVTLTLDMILIGFQRLSGYMFGQKFIKLSPPVRTLLC